MSHYITTEIDQEELALTGGSSHRTIRAVSETGFCIYSMFGAGDLDNGMSGSGGIKRVNFQIAGQAYLHATAWALSLQESFPKKFDLELKDILQFDNQFNEVVFNNTFSENEINGLIKEKRKYHSELSEDTIKRSIYLLYGILNFTVKIYNYTKMENEVEIYFG